MWRRIVIDDLLRPSLKKSEEYKTKSYDITNFFYLSFFGGILPTLILGTQNAKWLRANKTFTYVLLFMGIVVILLKAIVMSLAAKEMLSYDPSTLRWGARIIAVLFGFAYYRLLKPKYKQHQTFYGETITMWKWAIFWIIVSILVEGAINQLARGAIDAIYG